LALGGFAVQVVEGLVKCMYLRVTRLIILTSCVVSYGLCLTELVSFKTPVDISGYKIGSNRKKVSFDNKALGGVNELSDIGEIELICKTSNFGCLDNLVTSNVFVLTTEKYKTCANSCSSFVSLNPNGTCLVVAGVGFRSKCDCK
jgi:hypothetical protein